MAKKKKAPKRKARTKLSKDNLHLDPPLTPKNGASAYVQEIAINAILAGLKVAVPGWFHFKTQHFGGVQLPYKIAMLNEQPNELHYAFDLSSTTVDIEPPDAAVDGFANPYLDLTADQMALYTRVDLSLFDGNTGIPLMPQFQLDLQLRTWSLVAFSVKDGRVMLEVLGVVVQLNKNPDLQKLLNYLAAIGLASVTRKFEIKLADFDLIGMPIRLERTELKGNTATATLAS